MSSENTFQERAEKLSSDELKEWISLTSNDMQTVRKLLGNSTKLLIGPRGSGKSMLMRYAYYSCFGDSREVLPIYVNFEKYLHLEPLLHKTSNGNILFIKWVLSKIIVESAQSLQDCGAYEKESFNQLVFSLFTVNFEELKVLSYQLEGGTISDINYLSALSSIDISVGKVLEFITVLVDRTGRRRSILLLDDAAHAFSANLQKEFFDIFRILKTTNISGKAAVYPGLTSYSPYFNIGHDALFLESGYSPESDDYIKFCDDLLYKRLGEEHFSLLSANREGLTTLYYACNGIPRGLIVMSEYLLGEDDDRKISKQDYFDAIDEWMDAVDKFHTSLKTRLPRYTMFIDSGTELLQQVLSNIKIFNKEKDIDKKAVYFGLSNPIPNEITRVINILEYAGLLTEKKDISKGTKGVFTRYLVHMGKIIQYNALFEGHGKTLAYISECLRRVKIRQFKKINPNSFFGKDLKEKCKFVLPPCHSCGKPRILEDARFCTYCGTELRSASIFFEIIERDISILPLSSKKIKSIKSGSKIKTIKDIIMDENGVEIKKVKGIKGYWANKIRSIADEFVGG
ncbi:zinc ribbon domain-containing protein [Paenibacillus sp. MBLB4367]|uniref:zinc ribbon domain-containing protein n=1 Tax=Paenibacillus sp. MBLB4367 TaxID=3384767 RepID=UPI003907EC99